MKNKPQRERKARRPSSYTRNGKRPYVYPAFLGHLYPFEVLREMAQEARSVLVIGDELRGIAPPYEWRPAGLARRITDARPQR